MARKNDPPQDRQWYADLDRTEDELAVLTDEGRLFVAVIRQNLAESFGPEEEEAGQKVTNAFRRAVATVLSERGIRIDERPASVKLVEGFRPKTADLSFTTNGVRWVFEVKSGLEFNTLGAAVLEGVLFRLRQDETRFVLLSLYSKMSVPPNRLTGLLVELGVSHAFDHIVILSVNADDLAGVWWENMAARINDFFGIMPRPE